MLSTVSFQNFIMEWASLQLAPVQITVHAPWDLPVMRGVQASPVSGGPRGVQLAVTTAWLTPGTLTTMGLFPLHLLTAIPRMLTRLVSVNPTVWTPRLKMSFRRSTGQWIYMQYPVQKMIAINVSRPLDKEFINSGKFAWMSSITATLNTVSGYNWWMKFLQTFQC